MNYDQQTEKTVRLFGKAVHKLIENGVSDSAVATALISLGTALLLEAEGDMSTVSYLRTIAQQIEQIETSANTHYM